MVKIRLAAFAIAACPTASAAKSEAQAAMPTFSVPFELDHGHIFVSVSVDGKGPYRFGFDTGASGIGRVDASLTSELRLPAVAQPKPAMASGPPQPAKLRFRTCGLARSIDGMSRCFPVTTTLAARQA